MAQIITDAAGEAIFTGTPGRYRFDVLPPAGFNDAPDATVDVPASQIVDVPFGLTPITGQARVRVTNTATGQPVSGVTIEITANVP